jgi:hypothetical protein
LEGEFRQPNTDDATTIAARREFLLKSLGRYNILARSGIIDQT